MFTQETPLVSLLMLTYNQQNVVGDALKSLISQDYSNIEIIISDDCSTDSTLIEIEKVIKSFQFKNHVQISTNKKNLGLCANINSGIKKCKGELIFLAAGDDISLANRCSTVVQTWLAMHKQPLLIASDAYDMSISGETLGIKKTNDLEKYSTLKDWLDNPPYFFGSSHVWSRELVEMYPPLPEKMGAEDHLMVFRAILKGRAININQPLVMHRRGGITKRKFNTLEKKILRLKIGYEQNVAYYDQLIHDSRTDKFHHELVQHINQDMDRAKFAIELFNKKNKLEALAYALLAKKVSLLFRLRILTYSTFPFILKPIFILKKYLKKYEA